MFCKAHPRRAIHLSLFYSFRISKQLRGFVKCGFLFRILQPKNGW